jgi:predicted ATPase/DNA-binding SARP family transcriptional activator
VDAPPPAPALALRLFGVPAITADGRETPLRSERPHLLLLHLASRRDWVHRDTLANLFWPDHPPADARRNLRKVLLVAARTAHGIVFEREGDRVRWRPSTDVVRFEQACDTGRFDEAIELHRGPFLDGVDDALQGWDREWLLSERARLTSRWRAACERRLLELVGDPAAAAALAGRVAAYDPTDEAAVVALARARLALGDADAARQALADLRRRLAEDGASPSVEVSALELELQIRLTDPSVGSVAVTPDVERIVGRRTEVDAVCSSLSGAHGDRIVTLHGPGGVGKSTLSRRVAEVHATRTGQRVAWVPMADLTDIEQLPARIATRLGTPLRSGEEPWTSIASELSRARTLLVLDNAEHLPIGPALDRLYRESQGLALLVTSRLRTGAKHELLVPVEGLPLPDEDERDPDVLRAFDSVRLFEQRARMATPRFDLGRDAEATVRIVHRLGGLPLALELAAAWTRVLGVGDIAEELTESTELLDDGSRGARSSFETSWRLLDDSGRIALVRLACLPGPFDRKMAKEIAGVSLPTLANLVDSSLVHNDDDGRLSIHPLLQTLAAERLDDREKLEASHARWIAAWLAGSSDGSGPGPAGIDAIDGSLAHVRAAWNYAVCTPGTEWTAALAAMAQPLAAYHLERGLPAEGLAAFAHAHRRLAPDESAESRVAQVAVLRHLARMLYLAGRIDEAERTVAELLPLAINDPPASVAGLNLLGICHKQRGRWDEARTCFKEAVQLAETHRIRSAASVANLASVDLFGGDYAAAGRGYARALELHREVGNQAGVAATLCDCAHVAVALDDMTGALRHLSEAVVICKENAFRGQQLTAMANLGMVHEMIGNAMEASLWLRRALDEAVARDVPTTRIGVLLTLAELDAAAGAFEPARDKAWQAVALARHIGWPSVLVGCVAVLGEITARDGRAATGRAVVRWCLRRPEVDRLSRDLLQRRLSRLDSLPESDQERESVHGEFKAEASVEDVLARLV